MTVLLVADNFAALLEPGIRKKLGFKVMPLERIRWDMTWEELEAVADDLAAMDLLTERYTEQFSVSVCD